MRETGDLSWELVNFVLFVKFVNSVSCVTSESAQHSRGVESFDFEMMI